jgi:hypothetical protein
MARVCGFVPNDWNREGNVLKNINVLMLSWRNVECATIREGNDLNAKHNAG